MVGGKTCLAVGALLATMSVCLVGAADAPASAVWIGNGRAGDLTDADNWTCYDSANAVISGAVPDPSATRFYLNGSTEFNFPASASPVWKELVFSPFAGAKTVYGQYNRRRDTQNWTNTDANFPMQNYHWETMPAADYTSKGVHALENWALDLNQSQIRIEGWIYVTAAQAGTWSIQLKFDDYFRFYIDDNPIVGTITHRNAYTGTWTATAGWHRFRIICGDTYGGEGALLTYNNKATPLLISVNGAAAVPLEMGAFTLGQADNVISLAGDCDWTGLGTVDLPSGLVVNLNGHTLKVAGLDGGFADGVVFNGAGQVLVDGANGGSYDSRTLVLTGGAELVLTNAVVAKATWQGNGTPADLSDPANWRCFDSRGNQIAGGVPAASTVVTIPAETSFSLPAGSVLSCREVHFASSALKLVADCEWRGGLAGRAMPEGFAGRIYDWIDAPNTSWINTGFNPNQDTRVVYDGTVQSGDEYWFAATANPVSVTKWHRKNVFGMYNDNGNGVDNVYNIYGTQGVAQAPVVPNGRHVMEKDGDLEYIDGVIWFQHVPETFDVGKPIFLFAANAGGTPYRNKQTTLRMHGCRIYEDGVTLVRDFVPARYLDGTVGLFDKVGGTWYPNAGTGAFKLGPETLFGEQGVVAFPENLSLDLNGHAFAVDRFNGDSATFANSSETTAAIAIGIDAGASQAEKVMSFTGPIEVTLDCSGNEYELGTKLMSLGTCATGVSFKLDAATAAHGVELVVMGDGVYYGGEDPNPLAVRCKYFGAADRAVHPDESFMFLPLADYVDNIGTMANLDCVFAQGDDWQAQHLSHSQFRIDGWFKVTAEQAGEWEITQAFDDHMVFAVDGRVVVANRTFKKSLCVTNTMSAGWHNFTMVCGDTSGGFGAIVTGYEGRALQISINGAEKVNFNAPNFQFGDPLAEGDLALTFAGDCGAARMSLGEGRRLTLDPVATHVHLLNAPKFAAGSKITLAPQYASTYTSGRFRLLEWERGTLKLPQGEELASIFDAASVPNAANLGIEIKSVGRGGELWIDLDTAHAVASAVWIGGGQVTSIDDAANWRCTNSENEVLEGEVPGPGSAVSLSGMLSVSIPVNPGWKSVELSSVTLAADCDWRGLGVLAVVDGQTIELAGHKLYTRGLVSPGVVTVNDGTGGGELHLDIEEGHWFASSPLALTGSIKLVKEGAGTYLPTRSAQVYTGGTELVDGVTILQMGRSELNGDTRFNPQSLHQFGPDGSRLVIDEGAVLDAQGNYNLRSFDVVLNGGLFANYGYDMTRSMGGTAFGSLGADSSVALAFNTLFNCTAPCDLGGHTLTVDLADGKYMDVSGDLFANGKVRVGTRVTTGMFRLKGAVDTPLADYDIYSKVEAAYDFCVHDLTLHYEGNWGCSAVNRSIRVLGTFAPVSEYFPNVMMADGSTVDLSMKDQPMSVKSRDVKTSRNLDIEYYLGFEEGATVTIDVHGRQFSTSEPTAVLSWAGLRDDVREVCGSTTFQLDKESAAHNTFRVYDDALYVTRKSGIQIFVR